MKRDRPVASGSTIEGGGVMLVSPSRVPKTGSGTPAGRAPGTQGGWRGARSARRHGADTWGGDAPRPSGAPVASGANAKRWIHGVITRVRHGADHRLQSLLGGRVGSSAAPLGLCGLHVLVVSRASECGEVDGLKRYGENIVVTEARVRI